MDKAASLAVELLTLGKLQEISSLLCMTRALACAGGSGLEVPSAKRQRVTPSPPHQRWAEIGVNELLLDVHHGGDSSDSSAESGSPPLPSLLKT